MKLICLFVGTFLLFVSCTKLEVATPDFNVSIPTATYKAGDTVRFAFTGKADNIIFYSGEPGYDYKYKDRTSGEGIPQLDFTSFLQNKGEVNTLRLLVSTDFAGIYDTIHIRQATWTDITDKAVLSTGADGTPSGSIDLSELAKHNKPVYIAFRYQGYRDDVLKQPTWTIRAFNIKNNLPDGKASPITEIKEVGWVAFDFKNPTVTWAVPARGEISINGTIANSTKDDNEDWVVSKAFDLRKVTPDVSVSIQDLGSISLSGYPYAYNKPGNYTATFVAFNHSLDEERSVIRQVNITVTP